jgi:hypothetical protein
LKQWFLEIPLFTPNPKFPKDGVEQIAYQHPDEIASDSDSEAQAGKLNAFIFLPNRLINISSFCLSRRFQCYSHPWISRNWRSQCCSQFNLQRRPWISPN